MFEHFSPVRLALLMVAMLLDMSVISWPPSPPSFWLKRGGMPVSFVLLCFQNPLSLGILKFQKNNYLLVFLKFFMLNTCFFSSH